MTFDDFVENERMIEKTKLGIPQLIQPREVDELVVFKSGPISPDSSEKLSFNAPNIVGEYSFFVSELPLSDKANCSFGILEISY